MRAALRHMLPQQWGRIITMSSEGKVGKPARAQPVIATSSANPCLSG